MSKGGALIVDRHGRPMRPSASLLGYGGGYAGAHHDRATTRNWHARSLAGASEAKQSQPLSARARDLIRNNGVAKSGMLKARAQTIGVGLRLRAKPDARALGVSAEEALAFGRLMEREFNRWGYSKDNQCDLRRSLDFGRLQGIAWSDRFVAGENLIISRWKPDRGTRYSTCLQIVDPDRLSNPHGRAELDLLRQGIVLSEDGEPLAYHIRDRHEADMAPGADRYHWTEIPRVDVMGNRLVIHGFNADRSEQLRGVSVLAPILTTFRDLTKYADAEIGAATLHAIFAGVLTTASDPALMSEAMGLAGDEQGGMLGDWAKMRDEAYPEDFSVSGNRVTMLAPGDDFKVSDTSRQTAPFNDFKKAFLQDIAGAMRLAYPVLADDWEGVNYSSARAALAEVWRLVTDDRAGFVSDTMEPIYCNVITEAFDRGYLTEPAGWPSFYEYGEAYLKSYWTGPPRGYVDPLKEAQAGQLRLEMGVDTLEDVAAEQGKDWEDILDQRSLEKAAFEARGLIAPALADVLGTNADQAARDAENGA